MSTVIAIEHENQVAMFQHKKGKSREFIAHLTSEMESVTQEIQSQS